MRRILSILLLLISITSLTTAESKFSQKEWDLSAKVEKEILVLTSLYSRVFAVDYCDLKCKRIHHNKYTSPQILLESYWNIKNKEDFQKYINNEKYPECETYLKNYKLIYSNAGFRPATIARNKNKSLSGTAELFFCYDMIPTLGPRAFNAWYYSDKLFVLRAGFGAGYIKSSDYYKKSKVIVKKALSEYVDFDDFAGHYIAKVSQNILDIANRKDVAFEVEYWNAVKNEMPVEEVVFDATEASKTFALKIEDGIYKPSEYSKPLIDFLRMSMDKAGVEGIEIINKCYEQYGQLPFLSKGYEYINPVQYDSKSKESPEDFFEREYRTFWESLPEYQQFAIACSSNVFERDGMFHLDYSNRIVFNNKTSTGKSILNNSWKIKSYEQLMQNYEELTRGEQNANYRELKEALLKYPDLSPIEIGKKEDLNVTAVSRIYLVKDMMDKLGKHDIEAWIDARRISILRWGISAGYISYEEADPLIKTIVEKIKDDYVDFEDFISHWIAGYCYNAVFDSTCPDCTQALLKAVQTARAYIPFEELGFTGKNADPNHTMKLKDSVYTPSALAAKLIPMQKVYKRYWNDKPSKTILEDMIKEEENYPEISDIVFLPRLVLMANYSTEEEIVKYIESKNVYMYSLPEGSKTYDYAIRLYINMLNKTYQPQKVLSLYKSLSLSYQSDKDIYWHYAYANYLMSNLASSLLERDVYISRAVNLFLQLKARDYDLGNFINNWLKALEVL